MGYNLWLGERRELEDYYSRRLGIRSMDGQMMIGDSCDEESLAFIIDGVRKTDFTLDEIDSFICGFKNLEDLRRYLRLFDEYESVADKAGRLYIASKYDNIDKFKVIYNNPFLQKCAMNIRNKRKDGVPEFLDRTPEMRKYVERMAKYAVNSGTSNSIVNSSLFPPHVQKSLRYYALCVNDNDKNGASTNFENLFGYCMNYKTLRGFAVWEQEYLERQRSERKTNSSRSEKTQVYRKMQYEEELRFTPLDSQMMQEIDGMRDEDGNIDLDQVYSQFDFDDIHANSSRELQALGFLPTDDFGSTDGKVHRKK